MRAWPTPLRTDALRLTIVSDTHFGRRDFTQTAMSTAGPSLDREASRTDIFVDLGDAIHWRYADQKTAEDSAAKAWTAARKTATGKPWYAIAGNHDLQSYGTPFPNRTGDQWAADMGVGSRNQVVDWQDWARLVLVSPQTQVYDESKPGHAPMELSAAEVAWIKARADEVPERRVLVFFHAPLPAQYTSHMKDTLAQDMVAETPNIIGWVSGHRHVNLATDQYCFINHPASGRIIHHVNVPTFGGATGGYADDRWGQPFLSTHLTILPEGGLEVRCRDHMQSRWVPWWKTGMVTYLPPVN